jgi:hypothetical protein
MTDTYSSQPQPPQPFPGLLSPDQGNNAISQGLMSLGAGLMKAGGPSPYRNNFGAVGDAISGSLDSYNKAVSTQLQQKYLAGQITKEQFGTFQQALALRQQYIGQGVSEPKQVTDILGPMPVGVAPAAQANPDRANPTPAAPAAPTGPPALQGMLSANPGAPIVPPTGGPAPSPPGQNVFAANEKILPLSGAGPAAPTPAPGLLSPPPTFNQRFASATGGAPIGLLGAGGSPSPMGPPAAPQGPRLNGGSFGAPPAVRTQAIVPPPVGAPPTPVPTAAPGQPGANPAFANLTPQQHAVLLGGGPNAALLMKSLEPTPEMLNAKASGFGSPQEASNATEQEKFDVKRYGLLHQGLDGAAATAQNSKPFLDVGQALLNDPDFNSGTAEGAITAYKRALATLGINPNVAAPNEVFKKVMATNLLQQMNALKAESEEMGIAGGRFFQAQVEAMKDASANPDSSVAGNRALLAIYQKTTQRSLDMANMADNYVKPVSQGGLGHARLDATFESGLRDWVDKNPLFTAKELANPGQLGAAPRAPAKGPPPGYVHNGYTFKGGNANDQANWTAPAGVQ